MKTVRNDRTLRFAAGWFLYAVFLAFALDAPTPPNTLQGFATDFVRELALPYITGGLSASLPLIRGLSYASVAVFLATLFIDRLRFRALAKAAVQVLLITALFTIWIDKYILWGEGLTIVRVLLLAIDVFTKGPTMFFDIAASIGWVLAIWRIGGAIDATFTAEAGLKEKTSEPVYYGITMLGLSIVLLVVSNVPALTYMTLATRFATDQLGYETADIGYAMNIAQSLAILPLVLTGLAIDRIGRRRVAAIALLGLVAASLLSVLSWHLFMVSFHLALLQFFGSSLAVVAMTTLPCFYDKKLGIMEGLLGVSMVLLVPALMPNAIVQVGQGVHWPWIMVAVAVAVFVVVLPITLILFRNEASEIGCELDGNRKSLEGMRSESASRSEGLGLAAVLGTALFWCLLAGLCITDLFEARNLTQVTNVSPVAEAGGMTIRSYAFYCALGGVVGGWLCDRLAALNVIVLSLALTCLGLIVGSQAGLRLRPSEAQAWAACCLGMHLCATSVALARTFGRRNLGAIRATVVTLSGLLGTLASYLLAWCQGSLDSPTGLFLSVLATFAVAVAIGGLQYRRSRSDKYCIASAQVRQSAS